MTNLTRKLIAATAIALIMNSAANADIICGASEMIVGESGRNSVVTTHVAKETNNTWLIEHTLKDGTIVNRTTQYEVTNDPFNGKPGWSGTSRRNSNLLMSAVIDQTGPLTADYHEYLFDRGHGDKVLMHSKATCTIRPTEPQPQPQPQPLDSAPAPSHHDIIQLYDAGGANALDVIIGNNRWTDRMMLDTGATMISLPTSKIQTLVNAGDAYWTDKTVTTSRADGSSSVLKIAVIHKMTIGNTSIFNVLATGDAEIAPHLFGNLALAAFGPYKIDQTNRTLTFGE